ncbi:MAG: hypothetical protein BroJett026_25290 [Betaproteobacteria bacterium]|nr:MAG: hypothetical protein BroJett026_25290 [Betaproteobacteria bacterium]
MTTGATTVEAYLAALAAERREAVVPVRAFVGRALPAGFRETMSFGMIAWEVPLAREPRTYNGKALMRAGLEARERHCTLQLSRVYQNPQALALLGEGARREGKTLDMGKGCVGFRAPEALPLGTLLSGLPVDAFVAGQERSRAAAVRRPAGGAGARR